MLRRTTLAAILLALAACNKSRDTASRAQTDIGPPPQKVKGINGAEGEIVGTPARGSKFSRVQIGMPMKQVADLIGQPNDTSAHITGKSFIPFYFGGDTHRIEAFYRGEGQLAFAPSSFGNSANVLVKIYVNRAETGYAH